MRAAQPRVDVVVVGLGIMGSAIAAELAADGLRVLGVERFWPAHDLGSSAGESRLFRRVYPDDAEYAADTGAALREWLELQEECGQVLFLPTGGLLVAPAGSPALADAVRAGRGLPCRVLSNGELRGAYPALRFGAGTQGFLDEQAGVLLADRCVRAYQRKAVRHGAQLRFGCPVDLQTLLPEWESTGAVGSVRARCLVVAVGPWLAAVPDPWPPVVLERTVTHWLHADAAPVGPGPFVTWMTADLEFCMLPVIDGLAKVKFHHTGEAVPGGPHPRAATERECDEARATLEELAGLRLRHARARSAVYTNTADRKFVVARHPAVPRAVVVSACSGHGFKFAPTVAGRALAVVKETVG